MATLKIIHFDNQIQLQTQRYIEHSHSQSQTKQKLILYWSLGFYFFVIITCILSVTLGTREVFCSCIKNRSYVIVQGYL